MNDPLLLKQFEAEQEGVRKASDEREAEALKAVLLDQLIQVHPACMAGVAQSA